MAANWPFPTGWNSAVIALIFRAKWCLTESRVVEHFTLQPSDTVVAARDGIIEAEVDDEIVALSIQHGTCYGMNRVCSRIWKLLNKPIKISELEAALLAHYEVEPDVCTRQVIALLEELRAEGLIAVEQK